MKFLLAIIFLLFALVPTATLATATTGACTESVKTSADVGVFLQGVCGECWRLGDCSLNDFMTVVANAGNYILSIVAALVFLMYIGGGFFWVISHGDDKLVTKGKEWIKASTVGLIIVLVAYTGVVALRTAITQGTLSEGYVICAGNGNESNSDGDTDSVACGPNSTCYGYSCLSACEISGGSCISAEMATTMNTPTITVSCSAGTTSCPNATQQCCAPVAVTAPTP
jgi:hypothetical protein